MSLYQVHRPDKLSEIIGNETTVKKIKNKVEGGDPPHAILLHGPRGCLRGDTVIFDPIDKSNITVKERWENKKPFHVISCASDNQGVIAQALPPVQYSEDRMFRVETSESVFYVTYEHRFRLVSGEYLSLKELIGKQFSSYPLLSSWEFSPLVQPQDVHHCFEKEEGFQADYHQESHFYGERLPSFLKFFQSFFPLQDDALRHIRLGLRSDDLVDVKKHTPLFLKFSPLSMLDFFLQTTLFFWGLFVYPFSLKNALLPAYQHQTSGQFRFGLPLVYKKEKFYNLGVQLKSLTDKFLNSFPFGKSPLACSPSLNKKNKITGYTYIKEITEIVKEKYYDFHVPVYNNYWANGIFHHNCGKTTLAYIISKELGCKVSSNDFVELDAVQTGGIDSAREIRQNMNFLPMDSESKCRVWLIDEAHGSSTKFQEGLLKALESGPKHCYFILCTTELNKIMATVKSRCTQWKVGLLPDEKIKELLDWVLKKEAAANPDLTFEIADDVKEEIIKAADGSPREALVLLDDIIDLEPGEMIDAIQQSEAEKETKELCQAMLKGASWPELAEILKGIKGVEPEQMRRAIIGWFASVALDRNGYNKKNRAKWEEVAARSALVFDCFRETVFYTGRAGIDFAAYNTTL